MESLAHYLLKLFNKAVVFTFSIAWILMISIIIAFSYYSTSITFKDDLRTASRQITSFIYDRNLGLLTEYLSSSRQREQFSKVKVVSKENGVLIFEYDDTKSSVIPELCGTDNSSEVVHLYACSEIMSVKVLMLVTLALIFYSALLYLILIRMSRVGENALQKLSLELAATLEEKHTVSNFSIIEIHQLRETLFRKSRELIRLGEQATHVELSRKVAHDLRAPLGVMQNALKSNCIDAENMSLLVQSVDSLRRISEDLLSSTRESNFTDNERFHLKTVIEDLISLKIAEKKCHEVQFVNDVAEDVYLWVNKTKFKRAISNLFDNSLEALSESVTKTIAVFSEVFESELKLSIHDSGQGFGLQVLNGYSKSAFVSTKANGNGIGLISTKNFFQGYEGKMEIGNLPNGAFLDIFIPKPFFCFKMTPIVFIDDDKYLRLSWKKIGAEKGYEVLIFSSLEDFFREIGSIDKESEIFLDSQMGNNRGEEYISELLSRGFSKINMSTGRPASDFLDIKGINSVKGKSFPY